MALFGTSWSEDSQTDEYYKAYWEGRRIERKSTVEEIQMIINRSKDLTHDQKIKLWEDIDKLKSR